MQVYADHQGMPILLLVPAITEICNLTTIRSLRSIGTKLKSTANGVAHACPLKRSGKKLRVAQMEGPIHGVRALTLRLPITEVTSVIQLRLENMKRAKVHSASMIWRGMSGSGQPIGMMFT